MEPIQCAATMKRYVIIVIVPLLSVGIDQPSNVYYSCDCKASVYAEHLDSILEDRDVTQMRLFLNELSMILLLICQSFSMLPLVLLLALGGVPL